MFVVTHFDKYGTKEWLTLGKFASADEAARCYDRHVRATDGTKAKLNFPESAPGPAGGGSGSGGGGGGGGGGGTNGAGGAGAHGGARVKRARGERGRE